MSAANAFPHSDFRNRLLRWFDREKRTLPWRGETDPYRILVSEIMLQQTRVAVVKERYKQFLRQFPNVARLARSSEELVLAAWSGLGYYRRARALHAAARQIHMRRAFPGSSAELLELPGIGRYTAAAVASIAFAEPVAVVDGNVKRVLRRLMGKTLSDDSCWEKAQELLAPKRPGDFNQAMMELGAMVCLPGQPVCGGCPVLKLCASGHASGQDFSAVKKPERRKKATLRYLVARNNSRILLHQRSARVSLMPGMWELPQSEPARSEKMAGTKPLLQLRHSITTTDYTILVLTSTRKKAGRGSWVPLRSLSRLPLTGLARKILTRLELLR